MSKKYKFEIKDRVVRRNLLRDTRGTIMKRVHEKKGRRGDIYSVLWDSNIGVPSLYYDDYLELSGEVFMVWSGKVNNV